MRSGQDRTLGVCMGRLGWRFGMVLAMSSCIIYRVEPSEREDRESRGAPEPVPEFELPSDLWLVEDEATPGETLRTRLVTSDRGGLTGLQAVRFERDVTVVDAVFDTSRADLVVSVAKEAIPGSVDVVAQFQGGATIRLGDGFAIVAGQVSTGDTGMPTTTSPDTGAGPTGDTGP